MALIFFPLDVLFDGTEDLGGVVTIFPISVTIVFDLLHFLCQNLDLSGIEIQNDD